MEELFFSLFSQSPGTDSGTQVALYSLSAVLSVIACFMLAHRNDLGWWAQILSAFAGPLVIAMQYDMMLLLYGIPALLIGVFGLWRFSRFEFQGKFTRKVTRAPLTVGSAVLAVLGVATLTAAHMGEMLSTGFIFTPGTSTIWISFITEAVVLISFALIACGIRLGWLTMAAAAAVYVATLFNNNPAFALLGVWVFMVIAAVYGFFSWRNLPIRNEQPQVA
ncbi:hypothetical protein GCM10027417_01860 [Glutamicibacter endophyticus]